MNPNTYIYLTVPFMILTEIAGLQSAEQDSVHPYVRFLQAKEENWTMMNWTMIGSTIEAESYWSVYLPKPVTADLSSDGTTVALGAYVIDDPLVSHHVSVFKILDGNWTQIGETIERSNTGESYSNSVSLSSDGFSLAVGSSTPDNTDPDNDVKIYQYNTSTNIWEQIGNNIDLSEFSGYEFSPGQSLSLSCDGKTIAIGIFGCCVRVYQLNNDVWEKVGDNMVGDNSDDRGIHDVDLSCDGNIVAYGTWNTNIVGYFVVQQFIGGAWTKIGPSVECDAASNSYLITFYDTVSLSSDGKVLAIGCTDSEFIPNSIAKVYQLINDEWQQMGLDFVGEQGAAASAVSISSDGTTLAVGGFGYSGNGVALAGRARVYRMVSGTWEQVGSDIEGAKETTYLGRVVSLSSDGKTIAIVALGQFGGENNMGSVVVYSTNSGEETNDQNCCACCVVEFVTEALAAFIKSFF